VLTPLPIDDVLPSIIAALREQPTLVLCAPPGAGKTTRVPPAILDAGLAGDDTILVLQPRRVAARATAARMSVERQTKLGEEIGYRVRFESKVSKRTRIEVVTEGILLRRLLSDSFLDGVSVVVFDEFHERSLASDLALGMVRQVQEIRPELKVVVMSATLAAEPIARYLGNAPIIASEGRMFPKFAIGPNSKDGQAMRSQRLRFQKHFGKRRGIAWSFSLAWERFGMRPAGWKRGPRSRTCC
jgi:ATP-dependent helicase HrpB